MAKSGVIAQNPRTAILSAMGFITRMSRRWSTQIVCLPLVSVNVRALRAWMERIFTQDMTANKQEALRQFAIVLSRVPILPLATADIDLLG
jgi:hypothetical protein